MDQRIWLQLSRRPDLQSLKRAVRHVPASDIRSESVLRLFLAGYEYGFSLTDNQGRPTKTLYFLLSLLKPRYDWARKDWGPTPEVVRYEDLPENECRAFSRIPRRKGLDGKMQEVPVPWLARPGKWYIRNIADRIKYMGLTFHRSRDWATGLFPNMRAMPVYFVEEGKRRSRVIYLHECEPNWRLNDDVYTGVFYWNYENSSFRPAHGYAVLERLLTEKEDLWDRGGRPLEEQNSAAACAVQAPSSAAAP